MSTNVTSNKRYCVTLLRLFLCLNIAFNNTTVFAATPLSNPETSSTQPTTTLEQSLQAVTTASPVPTGSVTAESTLTVDPITSLTNALKASSTQAQNLNLLYGTSFKSTGPTTSWDSAVLVRITTAANYNEAGFLNQLKNTADLYRALQANSTLRQNFNTKYKTYLPATGSPTLTDNGVLFSITGAANYSQSSILGGLNSGTLATALRADAVQLQNFNTLYGTSIAATGTISAADDAILASVTGDSNYSQTTFLANLSSAANLYNALLADPAKLSLFNTQHNAALTATGVTPPISVQAQQTSTSAAMSEIASNGNVSGLFQGIRFTQITSLTSLSFWLSRYGNPSGKIIAKVYESVNGRPGTLVASSNKRNASDANSTGSVAYSAGSWMKFDFADAVTLDANKNYFISLEIVSGEYSTMGSGSNYIRAFRQESGDPYAGGSAQWSRYGNYTVLSGDWNFKFEGFAGNVLPTSVTANDRAALMNAVTTSGYNQANFLNQLAGNALLSTLRSNSTDLQNFNLMYGTSLPASGNASTADITVLANLANAANFNQTAFLTSLTKSANLYKALAADASKLALFNSQYGATLTASSVSAQNRTLLQNLTSAAGYDQTAFLNQLNATALLNALRADSTGILNFNQLYGTSLTQSGTISTADNSVLVNLANAANYNQTSLLSSVTSSVSLYKALIVDAARLAAFNFKYGAALSAAAAITSADRGILQNIVSASDYNQASFLASLIDNTTSLLNALKADPAQFQNLNLLYGTSFRSTGPTTSWDQTVLNNAVNAPNYNEANYLASLRLTADFYRALQANTSALQAFNAKYSKYLPATGTPTTADTAFLFTTTSAAGFNTAAFINNLLSGTLADVLRANSAQLQNFNRLYGTSIPATGTISAADNSVLLGVINGAGYNQAAFLLTLSSAANLYSALISGGKLDSFNSQYGTSLQSSGAVAAQDRDVLMSTVNESGYNQADFLTQLTKTELLNALQSDTETCGNFNLLYATSIPPATASLMSLMSLTPGISPADDAVLTEIVVAPNYNQASFLTSLTKAATLYKTLAADSAKLALFNIQYGTQLTVAGAPTSSIQAQQDSTSAAMSEIASNGNVNGIYQGIRFSEQTTVTNMTFWLNRYGNAMGKIVAKIYENVNGVPGTLVATSGKRDASELTSTSSTSHSAASWLNFEFASPVQLEGAKDYIISMEIVAPEYQTFGSGSNYIRAFRQESGNPYADGSALWSRGTTYTNLSGDWNFKIGGYAGGVLPSSVTANDRTALMDIVNASGYEQTTFLNQLGNNALLTSLRSNSENLQNFNLLYNTSIPASGTVSAADSAVLATITSTATFNLTAFIPAVNRVANLYTALRSDSAKLAIFNTQYSASIAATGTLSASNRSILLAVTNTTGYDQTTFLNSLTVPNPNPTPTPNPNPSPTPNPSNPNMLFSETAFWNQTLAANEPLASNSSTMVADLVKQTQQAAPWMNTTSWSTPVYVVDSSTPKAPLYIVQNGQTLTYTALNGETSKGIPIPANVSAAGGTDGHVTILDKSTDTLYEFWQFKKDSQGRWTASWGGIIKNYSTSDGRMPIMKNASGGNEMWGATATGLPAVGGTIMLKELQAGVIPHVLALSIITPKNTYVYPATRSDGSSTGVIPEGTVFRLPANYVVNPNLPPIMRMILTAIRDYGMVVRDRAGAVTFYGEDPKVYGSTNPYPSYYGGYQLWDLMKMVPWSQMQAVAPSAIQN